MAERRYRALLIGNSTFPTDRAGRLTPLRGPRNDVAALRAALVDDETGLHSPDDVTAIVDGKKAKVEDVIEEFFAEARRDDQLLFYFSGHGWPGHTGGLYFCVNDTNTDRLGSTAVSHSFLENVLERSPARAKVVLLDCCYSGNFKGAPSAQDFDGEGRFVMTSGRAAQVAPDAAEEGRPSPFTELVAEALTDGAGDEDGDGVVTADEVFRYVATAARERGLPTPQRNWHHAVGEVAIARRGTPAPAQAAPPSTRLVRRLPAAPRRKPWPQRRRLVLLGAAGAAAVAGAALAGFLVFAGKGAGSAFVSKTGNIQCAYVSGPDVVACRTATERHFVLVRRDGTVQQPSTVPPDVAMRLDSASSVLPYGRHWERGDAFRCDSRESGMTCFSKQHPDGGFEICRAGVDLLATNRTRLCK